jgi:hypothetical protein
MGYYTSYESEFTPSNEMIEVMSEISQYNDGVCFDGDEAKWYNFWEDIKDFSVRFPNRTFIWKCQGEFDSLYKAYARNGKTAQINGNVVFEDFNETMLK